MRRTARRDGRPIAKFGHRQIAVTGPSNRRILAQGQPRSLQISKLWPANTQQRAHHLICHVAQSRVRCRKSDQTSVCETSLVERPFAAPCPVRQIDLLIDHGFPPGKHRPSETSCQQT